MIHLYELPKDSLIVILSFCGIHDMISLEKSSKWLQVELLNHRHWTRVINDNFLASKSLTITIHNQHVKRILSFLMTSLKEHDIRHLIADVTNVTSVDRPEERGRNILQPSLCQWYYEIASSNPLFLNYARDAIGLHVQMECGCAGGSPCYWSSRPSKLSNTVETMTISLICSVSLIVAVSLTPYQAFFQPRSPTYAPLQVVVQILAPFGSNVYYTSEAFDIENVAKQQIFPLPKPVLCVGGVVQLVLIGRHQRQTIASDMDNTFEYYTCLSHAAVLGSPLDSCLIDATTSSEAAETHIRLVEPQTVSNTNLHGYATRYEQKALTSHVENCFRRLMSSNI